MNFKRVLKKLWVAALPHCDQFIKETPQKNSLIKITWIWQQSLSFLNKESDLANDV